MAKSRITRGTLQHHQNREKSLAHIVLSGEALRPLEYEYQGSAVVHFYAHRGNLFSFITHSTDMKKVPEQQASAGVVELSRALMSKYGRRPPETRNPELRAVDEGETNG